MESKKENIHVIYLGDLILSGSNIEKLSRQQLNYFGFDKIKFKRIAVTKEQIEEYHLPPQPEDIKTLEKLRKDPRTRLSIEEHGLLFAVELEALTAFLPDEFNG